MNDISTEARTTKEIADARYDMKISQQGEEDEESPRVLRLGDRRVDYDKRLAKGFAMLGLN